MQFDDSSLREQFSYDVVTTKSGKEISLFFIKHASLAFVFDGRVIYVDPVGQFADYSQLPKADLILVTHSHQDHLDPKAIREISTESTTIISDKSSANILDNSNTIALSPEDTTSVGDYAEVEAIAAYNTSEGHLQFHPQSRGDCGYVLTLDGARIYIAGDGEPTDQMRSLKNIDIVFLPVNQPYTMSVEQASAVIREMRPLIFYPYHYGDSDPKTNIAQLCYNVRGLTEIRIRPLE